MIISESLKDCAVDGRLTAGHQIVLTGVPVFAGTFTECALYASDSLPDGAWVIRGARGLALHAPCVVWTP